MIAFLGAWILFKTQLDHLEGMVRAITDILWTGSAASAPGAAATCARSTTRCSAIVVLWGIIALRLAQPIVLLQIGANVAGVVFVDRLAAPALHQHAAAAARTAAADVAPRGAGRDVAVLWILRLALTVERFLMTKSRLFAATFLTAGCAVALAAQAPAPAQSFDLVIKNARVFDGTGNPSFPADIAVRDGRIVHVGRLAERNGQAGDRCDGEVVAPGFIDIHSHADDGARARGGFRDENPQGPRGTDLVTQGITTVVVNHDGRSPWPIATQRALIEKNQIGPNTMLMVGHGSVRSQVMQADTKRPATAEEIAKMRELVPAGPEGRRRRPLGRTRIRAGALECDGRDRGTGEGVACV